MAEEVQNVEKPKEILEIEKAYGVELTEVSFQFDGSYELGNLEYSQENDSITSICLNSLKITNIKVITRLQSLNYLDLSDNLIEDISLLSSLKNLSVIFLTQNRIKDISPLFELNKISHLRVNKNQIVSTSGQLNISNILYEINVSDNFLTNVSFLQGLIGIDFFHADNNYILDVTSLAKLEIKGLSLRNNWIKNIDSLESVNAFLHFDVRDNLIKEISKEFARKNDWLREANIYYGLGDLYLQNNPLEFPPTSVIELGPENVKTYYENAEQYSHEALSEGRIIFVGDGGSGKSSIIEKVLYNSFAIGREQTNGINIENLYLKHPEDNRQLTFHIWDFGGQEIQHAVHKFFFTEGCLYVVVLDNRKEEEPEYWLQQIESLGDKAPVLVVFNKHDENAAETSDRKFLKEKYPNIIGFYNTSCKTGFGLQDFKNGLQEEVVKLRTVAERFPNNWLAIKKAIEKYTSGTEHYLTYEAYKEICNQNHLASEDAQKLLLRYFNTIGSVTWFGDDTYLKFLHVLNPAWITQGVYKILTAKKTANLYGQINVKDFKELLQPINKDDYTYDEEHYGYILGMMDKFKLCYTSDNKHLLIPSAFGKVPKVEYSDFRGEKIRTYILQFKDYMPLALIHRFTAQKLPEALDNNYWYTGIVIKDPLSETQAMVHADKEAKRMYVRIKGESKLAVWEHVRRDLATIASTYAKIPYDELVSLDERNEATVKYEDLISHLKAQKPTYFHPRLQKDFNVGYLMGLFETTGNTIEKLNKGELILNERERSPKEQIPPIVLQILNNNSPVVNANISTQVSVNIEVVNKISSDVKGDSTYLLEALGDSNKTLSEALQQVIAFANDVKAAKNTGDIKEKGWARKLKNVMATLKTGKEQLKNIQDGGEAMKGIIHGIKDLAHHFNLETITSLFS